MCPRIEKIMKPAKMLVPLLVRANKMESLKEITTLVKKTCRHYIREGKLSIRKSMIKKTDCNGFDNYS